MSRICLGRSMCHVAILAVMIGCGNEVKQPNLGRVDVASCRTGGLHARRAAEVDQIAASIDERVVKLWLGYSPPEIAKGQFFLPVPWPAVIQVLSSFNGGAWSFSGDIDGLRTRLDRKAHCRVREFNPSVVVGGRDRIPFVGYGVGIVPTHEPIDPAVCFSWALRRKDRDAKSHPDRLVVLSVFSEVIPSGPLPKIHGVHELIAGSLLGATCCGNRVTGREAARLVDALPDLRRITVRLRGDGRALWEAVTRHPGLLDVYVDWVDAPSKPRWLKRLGSGKRLRSLFVKARYGVDGSIIAGLVTSFHPTHIWISGGTFSGRELERVGSGQNVKELFLEGHLLGGTRCPTLRARPDIVGLIFNVGSVGHGPSKSPTNCVARILATMARQMRRGGAIIVGSHQMLELAKVMGREKSGTLDMLWVVRTGGSEAGLCPLVARTEPKLLRLSWLRQGDLVDCLQRNKSLIGLIWEFPSDRLWNGPSKPHSGELGLLGDVDAGLALPWSQLIGCAQQDRFAVFRRGKRTPIRECRSYQFEALRGVLGRLKRRRHAGK